jgi:putative two-component system response regulator
MSKKTILIVDDQPAILASMTKVLTPTYQVRVANSGNRALTVATKAPYPDLILLDVIMPDMDGYSVLSHLKENKITQDIPVIFVTAMESDEDEEKGLSLGAVDYIMKPIRPAIMMARIKTQLTLKQAKDFLLDKNDYLEAEVARRMKENQIIQNVSIRALAHLAETRDPETGDHILRTQYYVKLLAQHLQKHPRFSNILNNHFIENLSKSAPLHDIGKVGIPDNILLKPGKLTPDEFIIMKTHAEIGAKAIENAEKDVKHSVEFLKLAKDIAHWHHEKWDGSGYPDGLAGDDIPISARFMAIADVFDALISQRVYKPAFSFDKAREIIAAGRNYHFDPDITDIFLANYDKFIAIAQKYKAEIS